MLVVKFGILIELIERIYLTGHMSKVFKMKFEFIGVFICSFVTIATALLKYPRCHQNCSSSKLTCGFVILIPILCVLTLCDAAKIHVDEVKSTCDGGTITPREPMYVIGQNLTLFCNSRRNDSRKLYFIRGSNSQQLPDEFIQRINDSTIKLEYNVTEDAVKNHSSSMSYGCMKRRKNPRKKDICIDNVYVQLDYKPEPPTEIDCKIYDFSSIKCTWSLRNYVHDISVACIYKESYYDDINLLYKSDNEAAAWQTCPLQTDTSCIWQDEHYTEPLVLYLNLTVRNTGNNFTSTPEQRRFLKDDIIVPGQVENLRIIKNDKKDCVSLDWTPSRAGIVRDFIYNVTYHSDCSDTKWLVVEYNGSEERLDPVTICSLNPYTLYTYTVRGRILSPKTFDGNTTLIAKGYWSLPTDITYLTESDAISVNPEIIPGLYEIDTEKSLEKTGYSTLRVYWKPLPACEQHAPKNKVTYIINAYNITKTTDADRFFEQIDIPTNHHKINITVEALNNIGGPNMPHSITVYPSKHSPEPSELIVWYNDSNHDCNMFGKIETHHGRTLPHTIVWCKGTVKCMEPLHWEILRENVSLHKFPDNVCGDTNYKFGLITYGGQEPMTNTGIHWTKCIYQIGKVPNEPLKNVRAIPGPKPEVEWTPYDCHKIRTYVKWYNVSFCPTDVDDHNKCKCNGEVQIKQASRNVSKFIDNRTTSVERMCIWVTPITESGPAPSSAPVIWIADSGQYNYVVVYIIVSSIVAVLGVICIIVCCRRRWLRLKEENQVKIPEISELPLLDEPLTNNKKSDDDDGVSVKSDSQDFKEDVGIKTLDGYRAVGDESDDYDGYEGSECQVNENKDEEQNYDMDVYESKQEAPVKSLNGYKSLEGIIVPNGLNIKKLEGNVCTDKIEHNGLIIKDTPDNVIEKLNCSKPTGGEKFESEKAMDTDCNVAIFPEDSHGIVGQYDDVGNFNLDGSGYDVESNDVKLVGNYKAGNEMTSSDTELDGIDYDDNDDGNENIDISENETESSGDSHDKKERVTLSKNESVNDSDMSTSPEEYMKAFNANSCETMYHHPKNGIHIIKKGLCLPNGIHMTKEKNSNVEV